MYSPPPPAGFAINPASPAVTGPASYTGTPETCPEAGLKQIIKGWTGGGYIWQGGSWPVCERVNARGARVRITMPLGFGVDIAEAQKSLWPLEAGKEVRADYISGGRPYHEEWKVLGLEDVATAAGVFKAFRVELATVSKLGDFRRAETYWVLPSNGLYVKHARDLTIGNNPSDDSWETVSLQMQ